MLDHFGVTESELARRRQKDRTSESESPLFVGRAVAALARRASRL